MSGLGYGPREGFAVDSPNGLFAGCVDLAQHDDVRVDKAADEVSLRAAWRSLGQRIAVAGGSFVALLSLFHHVPASTAALRGGAAWLGVILLTRFSGFVLAHAYRLDTRTEDENPEEKQRV